MRRYEKLILIHAVVMLELLGDGNLQPAEAGEIVELGITYRPSRMADRSLSGAERKRYSTVADRMERARLIRRVRSLDCRTTHYQLTDDGLAAALSAIKSEGSEPDSVALNKGIALVAESWQLEHTTTSKEGLKNESIKTTTSSRTRSSR